MYNIIKSVLQDWLGDDAKNSRCEEKERCLRHVGDDQCQEYLIWTAALVCFVSAIVLLQHFYTSTYRRDRDIVASFVEKEGIAVAQHQLSQDMSTRMRQPQQ